MRYCSCGWLFAASLALLASSFSPKSPFVGVGRTHQTCTIWATSVGAESSRGSSNEGSDGDSDKERTLYDVLGASPDESQEVLRMRYTKAVKRAHPDATRGVTGGHGGGGVEFAEIAAAWSVLSDPKERRRYDRELKAKEFTENFGGFLETSIRTAVPFLRKTANTTVAVVETSSKNINKTAVNLGNAMQDVGQMMKRAADLLELDKKRNELELQAAKEMARATKLRNQLTSDRHLDTLRNSKSELSSVQAIRILEGFKHIQDEKKPPAQINLPDIVALEKVELEYNDKMKKRKQLEMDTMRAETKANEAVDAEERALKRLEQAQRELEAAKRNVENCEKLEKEAMQRELQADKELEKVLLSLEKRQDGVRNALQRKEEENLRKEDAVLKDDIERLETKAKSLQSSAQEVKVQADKLRREQ